MADGIFGLINSPAGQGLLAAGLGALASRGSTTQALGRGGLLGLSVYGAAQDNQRNQLMEMAQQRMRDDVLAKIDAGQTPTARELARVSDDPRKWASVVAAGRPELDQVDAGGGILFANPFTGQAVRSVTKTPTIGEAMTNVNNPVTIGPGGQPVPNQALWNTQQATEDAALSRDLTRTQFAEQARARGELVSVPDGQGGTRLMPREQALAVLGAAAQGSASGDQATGGLGTQISDEQRKFRARVPDLMSQSTGMLDSLTGVLNHPGKNVRLGALSYVPRMAIRGTEGYAFDIANDQLQGQIFLEGYERLKGGGVITDYEGSKAEKAISRLDKGLSHKEYDAAVRDLAGVVISGMKRTYTKAGIPIPDEVQQQIADYERALGIGGNTQTDRPPLADIFGQ